MSDLSILEQRLDAALARLEEARSSDAAADDGNDAQEQIAALQEENRRLSKDLDKLQSERAKDLAQLDTLIDQLRPLIEEAS